MSNTSNQHNARAFIATKKEFKVGNVFAQFTQLEGKEFGYCVYSYSRHFPMFYYSNVRKQWFVNMDRYSTSTSCHRSQMWIAGLFNDAPKLNTEDILDVIYLDGLKSSNSLENIKLWKKAYSNRKHLAKFK